LSPCSPIIALTSVAANLAAIIGGVLVFDEPADARNPPHDLTCWVDRAPPAGTQRLGNAIRYGGSATAYRV
jgi:hypothetical protein